jgi:hypothetical protein
LAISVKKPLRGRREYKIRVRKGNVADVWATAHPLRVFLEFGLLSTASSDFGRRKARNADQTGNQK